MFIFLKVKLKTILRGFLIEKSEGKKDLVPTDAKFVGLDDIKALGLSMWRRALYLCFSYTETTISANDVCDSLNLKTNQVSKILNKMVKESHLICLNKKEYFF